MGVGTQLTVFVYGTLRPGEGNHGIIRAWTVGCRSAVLADHAMYAAGLPYVVAQVGCEVRGDLLELDPGRYDVALQRLDRLEGYAPHRPAGRCHYVRTRCVVRLSDGDRRLAWVYLAGPGAVARVVSPSALVCCGDWKKVGHHAA